MIRTAHCSTALCRAVSDALLPISVLAPILSRRETAFVWFQTTDRYSGVQPIFPSVWLISSPFSKAVEIILVSPRRQPFSKDII